ncbi:cofilin [Puccinia graminis f. sp. tritici]|uniref:Cofilin n=2 Tax=Puccinia graminis f. sp. tritici TaxID=56615 RepID=E3KQ45_PUCGT|nr:cofilin [Puccinia graminis f. sp. tritici CRL 75-36-700-3]EFP86420.2 cofilin [Puccinia graminis f. sp. tritici CRL 75-36-700-3]KAA1085064.1 cofilin [Puccinia graminis f. sp. tritici]KAA1108108.1 cofilin [Puccinia graminis f. sp. tritici]
MSSGVTVHPQCMHDFIDLKLKKKSKYIIYAISDDSKEIVVEKVSEAQSYDDFLEDLPSGSCRYAVYDFEYCAEETEGKRNKLCFFTWSPDDAKIKNKMVYAASKRALREALVGIALEIQGTDASEVAYQTVLEKALKR